MNQSDRRAWHFQDELDATETAGNLRNTLRSVGAMYFLALQQLEDLIFYFEKSKLEAERAPESLADAVAEIRSSFPSLNFTAHFRNYKTSGGWTWESHLPCALYLTGRFDDARRFLDEFTLPFPANPMANSYYERYLEFARRLRERLDKHRGPEPSGSEPRKLGRG
jgi:hypothetical protein